MKPARLLAACAVLFACTGRSTMTSTGGERAPDRSAIVIQGSELVGSLLDGLRTRLPAMTVSTQNTACPVIIFRGTRSIRNQGNPSVYVDGTLMADTCVLQQINSNDVDRVVIYPSGLVSEPGVRQNASGVILVHRVRE